MHTLFTFPGDGPKAYWKRLGIGQSETSRVIELNDTALTFPQIADAVASEFGWDYDRHD